MKLNNVWAAGTVALLVGLTTTAHAVSLAGQGASLPEYAYTGTLNATYPATVAPKTVSLFGQFNSTTGNTVSYAGTGSGAGKTALITNASPFSASDSPLTQANYSDVIAGAGGSVHTAPVQVPAIVGAVAVVYHLPTPQTANLNLTSATLAKIFAGQITDWKDVPNSGIPSTSTALNPIHLAARAKASGTTFSFVNHLNAVGGLAGGKFFKVDELFANAVSGMTSVTFAGQANNQAVIDYVKATAGSIGYAEAANAYHTAGVTISLINGYSPASPNASFLSTAAVVTDQVITGSNPTTGAATLAAITGVPAGKAGFIKLVKPNVYANRTNVYPILAVSYLLGYTNANGDAPTLAAVKGVLKAPYNANFQAALGVPGARGYAFLPAALTTSLSALLDTLQ
jgi:ABC-type phosphate transport system substrate-binding protein